MTAPIFDRRTVLIGGGAGIGLIVSSWLVFWIGIAMWPVGDIVAKVMQKKGLGSETSAINAER